MNNLLNTLDSKLVKKIEDIKIPSLLLVVFLFIISFLRMYFEAVFICERCNGILPMVVYSHGIAMFFFAYISGNVVIKYLTHYDWYKILKISFIGFLITLLPPVMDGVVFGRTTIYKYANFFYTPEGQKMFYSVKDLLFNFSNDFVGGPALRMEFWFITFLASFYVLLKSKKMIRWLLAFALIMCIFIFVAYQQLLWHILTHEFEQWLAFLQQRRLFTVDKFLTFLWSFYSIILLVLFFFSEFKASFFQRKLYSTVILCLVGITFLSLLFYNPSVVEMFLYHLKFMAAALAISLMILINVPSKEYRFISGFLFLLACLQLPALSPVMFFILLLMLLCVGIVYILQLTTPFAIVKITLPAVLIFWGVENSYFLYFAITH